MNSVNPIIFLISASQILEGAHRIYNNNDFNWLSVDGSDHQIKTRIDWRYVKDFLGDRPTSIDLYNLKAPSLPEDLNTKVIFVDEATEQSCVGEVCGYMVVQGGSTFWFDESGHKWPMCFKYVDKKKCKSITDLAEEFKQRVAERQAEEEKQGKRWGSFEKEIKTPEMKDPGFMWMNAENKMASLLEFDCTAREDQDDLSKGQLDAIHCLTGDAPSCCTGDHLVYDKSCGEYKRIDGLTPESLPLSVPEEEVEVPEDPHLRVLRESAKARPQYIEDQRATFQYMQDLHEQYKIVQKLKLIGKAEDYEGGWFGTWSEELELGHTFRFMGLAGSNGILVTSCENGRNYLLPFFVLQDITEKHQ